MPASAQNLYTSCVFSGWSGRHGSQRSKEAFGSPPSSQMGSTIFTDLWIYSLPSLSSTSSFDEQVPTRDTKLWPSPPTFYELGLGGRRRAWSIPDVVASHWYRSCFSLQFDYPFGLFCIFFAKLKVIFQLPSPSSPPKTVRLEPLSIHPGPAI